MVAPGTDRVEIGLELRVVEFAAMRSRRSLVYQWVSSMSTIVMPMLMESAPIQGCGL